MLLSKIKELEIYAKENNIPIMEKEGILFLLNYIKENNIKTVLEIGSAIGYSAILIANEGVKVTTIERDKKRFDIALNNIKEAGLDISIYNEDALLFETKDKYDLIFIDAAKSQYINFFNKYKHNLNDNGVIISDNLYFHGLVGNKEVNLSRNVKGIVRKLSNYINFLETNEEYITKFIHVGDGISITRKR
jgi:predicted O-methyltransferase YrrM